MIADARMAEALAQFVGNELPLCPGCGHSIHKSSNVVCKIMLTVFGEQTGDGAPTAFDLAACFHKGALIRFDTSVPLEQLSRDGFGLSTDVGGIAA